METKNYENAKEALRSLTDRLSDLIKQKKGDVFNLALSGGETAKQMFTLWATDYKSVINWPVIRFYWVDERCVPKTDDESNYYHALELLFKPLQIAKNHVHRIKGENYPAAEAKRYSNRVAEKLLNYNGLPHFDCIILGIGSDLHTASIFPANMDLLEDKEIYAVSKHPLTGQNRITMTGPVILNHVPLLIPILGKEKKDMVKQLEKGYSEDNPLPATYILSQAKDVTIYLCLE